MACCKLGAKWVSTETPWSLVANGVYGQHRNVPLYTVLSVVLVAGGRKWLQHCTRTMLLWLPHLNGKILQQVSDAL